MSPFPAVFQDVSLIVAEDVAAQAVVDAVREGAGELLEDVRLFDVYTGPQIGEGRKSLALALRFRAAGPDADRGRGQRRARRRGGAAAERVGAVQRALTGTASCAMARAERAGARRKSASPPRKLVCIRLHNHAESSHDHCGASPAPAGTRAVRSCGCCSATRPTRTAG